ncbi:MAG: nucleolar RNA-binding Nop10p family protein [Candidatus Micrarchaeota archaeon]
MFLLKTCNNCSTYTLRESCPKCGAGAHAAHPPKYSKEDRYAIYRRKELFPQLFK